MNCQQVEPLLSSYLGGQRELGERVFGVVTDHVQGCRACSDHLDDLRWVVAQVKAQPRPQAPTDLAAKLHNRLALEPTPAKPGIFARLGLTPNWPSVAAGAAIAAVLMFFVLRGP